MGPVWGKQRSVRNIFLTTRSAVQQERRAQNYHLGAEMMGESTPCPGPGGRRPVLHTPGATGPPALPQSSPLVFFSDSTVSLRCSVLRYKPVFSQQC